MSTKDGSQLTRGRLLARNVVWNLAGQLLPLAVGVLAVPPLIHGLGVERFGVMTLAWTLVGYFSLFDLGLGRALTKMVADRFALDRDCAVGSIAWTGVLLLLVLGAVGAVVIWILTPWLVRDALGITGGLQTEALWSFYILGAAIPLITITSGFRGVLEARQHFSAVNLIRLPMSLFMFVGPLLVLPFSHSLVPVVMTLVGARVVGAVVHLLVCLRTFPSLRGAIVFDRAVVAPALRLGGWMTVTNVVGPVMAYLDRFLVGMVLSVGAIAYYSAPFDVVTRFLVVPGAVVGVLFPAFASSLAGDRARGTLLLARGTKYIFLAVLPIVLVTVTLAPEALDFWLGPSFSERSAGPLRWLAVGVLANGLAQVPFAFLQAAGKPRLTATLHLLELPFYLAVLWALTRSYGITGTAVAWTARATFDGIILFALVGRFLPDARGFLSRLAFGAAGSVVLFLVAALLVGGMMAKVVFLALGLLGVALVAWRSLNAEERIFVMRAAAAVR